MSQAAGPELVVMHRLCVSQNPGAKFYARREKTSEKR